MYIKWIYKHTVWNSDAVKTALENVRSGSLLSHSKRRHIESSWTPPSFTHTLRPYPDKRMDVDLTTNNLFSKGRKRARLQKISEIREPDSECVWDQVFRSGTWQWTHVSVNVRICEIIHLFTAGIWDSERMMKNEQHMRRTGEMADLVLDTSSSIIFNLEEFLHKV